MAKARSPREGAVVTLALPRLRHTPGENGEPDRETLRRAKLWVPERFEAFVPADHPVFLYGLALHDAAFLWEAHEIWEAIWKAAPMNGQDRIALQTLIQIANAGLKRRMNRPRAGARLIEAAEVLLGEFLARGPAAAALSVAGRLKAHALREELPHWFINGPRRLETFFARRDEETCTRPLG
jgi:hypothetical protein